MNDRVKQVSGTLIIKDAVIEDSGKYLCVVNNSVGGESVETVLTVTAPLSAKIDPPTQTVDFGRPAVFTCHYSGNPIKTVSWMKDGKPLPGHSDAILRIESVKKEDNGMYQCFVRNDQESAQASAELKLGGRCKYRSAFRNPKNFLMKINHFRIDLLIIFFIHSRSTSHSTCICRGNSSSRSTNILVSASIMITNRQN